MCIGDEYEFTFKYSSNFGRVTVTTTDKVFEIRSYDKTASRNKSISLKMSKLNQKVFKYRQYSALLILPFDLYGLTCVYVLQPHESNSAPATVRAPITGSNGEDDQEEDVSFFELMRGKNSPRPDRLNVPPAVGVSAESKLGSPARRAEVPKAE